MSTAALLMLKAPRPGFVKTRLAAELGAEAACEAYRAMVEKQLREIPEVWAIVVHFAPADARGEMERWVNIQHSTSNIQHPSGSERLRRMGGGGGALGERTLRSPQYHAQVEGDLGTRMDAAVRAAWAQGFERAVLLGGDCPWITCGLLRRAERELAEHDLVIGPATDGGYYLLGLNAGAVGPFDGIAWSTERVLAQTLRLAEEAGQRVALLPELEDVDDLGAWKRAQAALSP